MSVKIREVCEWIDRFAPFELAETWDNVGILAGSAEREIDTILCSLDLNPGVIAEAREKGAQLIITHHPILFRGRKNLREDDAEGRMLCELIRANIGLIAAHTNFDNAEPGVNNALANELGLTEVNAYENGMRVGTTGQKTLGELTAHIEACLGGPVRVYGEADTPVRRVALLGGAGGDFCPEAIAAGADVYLTGEVAHHKAWDAYLNGLCVLEGGHAATELPGVRLMCEKLKEQAADTGREVCVLVSETKLFR